MSSKGDNGVIHVYVIENDRLIKIQEYSLYGYYPTSIAIKDNILIAVDGQASIVEIAIIDEESGMLTAGDYNSTPNSPDFVMFLN